MISTSKILVIDESTFLTQILVRQLHAADFAAKSANSGAEAIEIMRDWIADIVILDQALSDVDSLELARQFHQQYPGSTLILSSTYAREQMEVNLHDYGIKSFLQKPIAKEKLLEMVRYLGLERVESHGKSAVILPSPPSQPYEVHVKSCYCCGFEEVKVFVAKENSFIENWDRGLYPIYEAEAGFHVWDHLKTMISVCPLCLFASADLNDFAEKNHHHEFPYRSEARKILSSGIGTRKKLIGLRGDERDYFDFDNPNRDQKQVIQSLQLAQKCGNAMILADKPGAHSHLGKLYVLEQSLREKPDPEILRTALGFFQGQIKAPMSSRAAIAMSYYFSITCHFALSESVKANENREQLEAFYQHVDPADASEEECLWNERLVYVWKMGVDLKERRQVL